VSPEEYGGLRFWASTATLAKSPLLGSWPLFSWAWHCASPPSSPHAVVIAAEKGILSDGFEIAKRDIGVFDGLFDDGVLVDVVGLQQHLQGYIYFFTRVQ
jgi:hypothetical protein